MNTRKMKIKYILVFFVISTLFILPENSIGGNWKEKISQGIKNIKESYSRKKDERADRRRVEVREESSSISKSTTNNNGAIHGRVWVNNIPSGNVYVKVLDSETNNAISAALTRGGGDSTAGWYQITNLPAGKKYKVVATWKG